MLLHFLFQSSCLMATFVYPRNTCLGVNIIGSYKIDLYSVFSKALLFSSFIFKYFSPIFFFLQPRKIGVVFNASNLIINYFKLHFFDFVVSFNKVLQMTKERIKFGSIISNVMIYTIIFIFIYFMLKVSE